MNTSASSKKLSKKRQLRIRENESIIRKNIIILLVINVLYVLRFLVLNSLLLTFRWIFLTLVLVALYGAAFFMLNNYAKPKEYDIPSLKERKGTMAETYFDVIHMGWVIQTLSILFGSAYPFLFLFIIPIAIVYKSWGILRTGLQFARQFQQAKAMQKAS